MRSCFKRIITGEKNLRLEAEADDDYDDNNRYH
jgi:hypothetical protein